MENWVTSKLSDVIEIIGGGTPKRSEQSYWNGDIPWLSVADFNNDYRFVSSSNETITKLGLEKSNTKLLEKDQIIISARGTVGCLAQVAKPMAFNQSCYGISGKKGIIDNGFLYYFLKNSIDELKQKTHGAVFDTITRDTFEYIEVKYPNLDKQITISDILGAFDNKIELNTQTNQTLEQIAQTIFKSWFIDFDPVKAKATALAEGKTSEQVNLAAMATLSGKAIETLSPAEYQQLWNIAEAFPSEMVENEEFGEVPKGWRLGSLADICSMRNGYAFKSNEWTESGIPVIKIGSVKPILVEVEGNGFVDPANEYQRKDFLLTEGDIVVGLTGYVGEVGRVPKGEKAMLNQRVAKFLPIEFENKVTYYSYIYCVTRDNAFKSFAEQNAKGSAQANISTKELLSYPIVIANPEIHILFEDLLKNKLDKILLNAQQSKTLAQIRDELLPKLLNGELTNAVVA